MSGLIPNPQTGMAEVTHPDYPNVRLPAFVLVPNGEGLSVRLSTQQAQILSDQFQRQGEILTESRALKAVLNTVQQLLGNIKTQGTDQIAASTAGTATATANNLVVLDAIRSVVNQISQNQGDISGIETNVQAIVASVNQVDSKLGTTLSRLAEQLVELTETSDGVELVRQRLVSVHAIVGASNSTLSAMNGTLAQQSYSQQNFQTVSLLVKDTQYFYDVPAGTKALTISLGRLPGAPGGQIRYAWVNGAVASGACGFIEEDFQEEIQMFFSSQRRLYLRGDTDGMTVVIKRFS